MTAEQEKALTDAYPEFYRRALADAPPLSPEAVRAIRALLRQRPPAPVPGTDAP